MPVVDRNYALSIPWPGKCRVFLRWIDVPNWSAYGLLGSSLYGASCFGSPIPILMMPLPSNRVKSGKIRVLDSSCAEHLWDTFHHNLLRWTGVWISRERLTSRRSRGLISFVRASSLRWGSYSLIAPSLTPDLIPFFNTKPYSISFQALALLSLQWDCLLLHHLDKVRVLLVPGILSRCAQALRMTWRSHVFMPCWSGTSRVSS